MDIDLLKQKLQYYDTDNNGIMVYFLLKNDSETTIKLADIDNENALPELKDLYIDSIKRQIIDNVDLQVMTLSATDNRKNVIYEYDLEEIPDSLSFISDINNGQRIPNFRFNEDNIEDIKGYYIVIGNSTNKLILYKQYYAISVIRRNSFLMYKSAERFVRFNDDLIRLDDDFQLFYLDNTLFIKNLDVLEKFFGFYNIIFKEADLSITNIEQANILESVELLRESIKDVSFARKLTKLSTNSPVLGNIPVSTIIEFSRLHPGLAGKFKYNEHGNRICLDTKKSQNLFINLLKDNYLKSELTNMYYASQAKDNIVEDNTSDQNLTVVTVS